MADHQDEAPGAAEPLRARFLVSTPAVQGDVSSTPTIPRPIDSSGSDNTIFWCQKTLKDFGPDDGFRSADVRDHPQLRTGLRDGNRCGDLGLPV